MRCWAEQGIHLCPIMGYKLYPLQQYSQTKLKHLNVSPILPLTDGNTVILILTLVILMLFQQSWNIKGNCQ